MIALNGRTLSLGELTSWIPVSTGNAESCEAPFLRGSMHWWILQKHFSSHRSFHTKIYCGTDQSPEDMVDLLETCWLYPPIDVCVDAGAAYAAIEAIECSELAGSPPEVASHICPGQVITVNHSKLVLDGCNGHARRRPHQSCVSIEHFSKLCSRRANVNADDLPSDT